MHIRHAKLDDLNALAAIETACFPPAEAASRAALAARLAVYPTHFWLLCAEDDAPIAFVNGMVVDEPHLQDEMYADATLHTGNGAWQMLFGVCTLPQYRRQGMAGQLLHRVVQDARVQGRQGVVLTCKSCLVPFYATFGFVDEGVSSSEHGGVTWHEMRRRFQ